MKEKYKERVRTINYDDPIYEGMSKKRIKKIIKKDIKKEYRKSLKSQ